MSRKRSLGEDGIEATPNSTIYSLPTDQSKGLAREISPPPLRRRISSRPDTMPSVIGNRKKKTATNLLPGQGPRPENQTTISIYHKDKRRGFFYVVSEETELAMVTANPGRFGYIGARPDPPDQLGAKISETVRELSKSIKPDVGGFISVDYPLDDSKNEDNAQDVFLSSPPKEAQSSALCRLCQKAVSESSVMNRPWRESEVRGDPNAPVRIQEESVIEYHGPKVNVFGHHGQLGALRKSARTGCHLCALLDAADPKISVTYDESSRIPYVLKVIYAKNHNEGPGVLVVQAKGKPTWATYLMYDETSRKIGGTLDKIRTDEDSIINLGRQWLEECLEKHEDCRARAVESTKFIPTRLIKVQANGKSVESLRLVIGCDLPPNSVYLTLSHCWGGAQIIKLTKATLESFQKEIPSSSLPKNFMDAAIITAALKYEYIWIDSLCIIQDSEVDWKKEAAKMGSVYRHSVCTIAAAGAKDSHGGCFATRSALSFMPCQLIPKTEKGPGVYAENWGSQPTPLHTRAWVVQERCLSIRTLNFGANMLAWDCISSKASEQEPKMQSTNYDASLKRVFNDLLSHPPDAVRWTNSWWKLVLEYSSCNLTFTSDKWPAIEGLAAEVETHSKKSLVHGLWGHNLADELLWCISKPQKTRLSIGAPSWSWLSIDGKVHRRRYNYAMDFRLDATAEAIRTQDGQSETFDKELKVTARMLPLRWTLRADDKDSTPSYNFVLIDNKPNEEYEKPKDWLGRWIPDTIADENWETWSLQIVRADELQLKGRVGLVVVPVEDRENTWRRVGFYEVNWRDESHRDENVTKRWFGFKRRLTLV